MVLRKRLRLVLEASDGCVNPSNLYAIEIRTTTTITTTITTNDTLGKWFEEEIMAFNSPFDFQAGNGPRIAPMKCGCVVSRHKRRPGVVPLVFRKKVI